MKRFLTMVALVLPMMVSLGCRGEHDAHGDQTATIAPAKPPQTATDEAIQTQTTEVGEERSPNEGGILTDSEPPAAPATGGSPPPATTST